MMGGMKSTRLVYIRFVPVLCLIFLLIAQPAMAQSCGYPDFYLLDYDINNSQNSVHAYSYEPPTGDLGTYQGQVVAAAAGHVGVHGLALGPESTLYLAKFAGSEFIQSYLMPADGSLAAAPGETYSNPAMSGIGHGVALDRDRDILYVLSSYGTAIFAVDMAGGVTQIAGAPQAGGQWSQFGIEVGPDHRLYVMTENDTVEVYDPSLPMGSNYGGVFAVGTGSGDYGSRDIAFDAAGNMYASGTGNSAGAQVIKRYQGPAGANPGAYLDEMTVQQNNGEWPHGLAFHPTTGELFVASFSQAGGIHVYDYAPGTGVPKVVLNHLNPANGNALAKDIQFAPCAPVAPTAITGALDLHLSATNPIGITVWSLVLTALTLGTVWLARGLFTVEGSDLPSRR